MSRFKNVSLSALRDASPSKQSLVKICSISGRVSSAYCHSKSSKLWDYLCQAWRMCQLVPRCPEAQSSRLRQNLKQPAKQAKRNSVKQPDARLAALRVWWIYLHFLPVYGTVLHSLLIITWQSLYTQLIFFQARAIRRACELSSEFASTQNVTRESPKTFFLRDKLGHQICFSVSHKSQPVGPGTYSASPRHFFPICYSRAFPLALIVVCVDWVKCAAVSQT